MTFGDGTMIYHPAGIVDLSSTIISVSQQLDQIAEEAHHLLAGSQDFFQGPQGATQYAQAQHLINQGIAEGKSVLYNQGGVVEEVGQNMSNTDTAVGNGFMSV
jgi:uncharacterized protein YukE